ncbi:MULTISPECIES: D-isomer specific 2-hydroxyacid dehydrogenase family protein [Streptosporangium]|uniref:Phosphoglycerate dehydrogenase-like enzyme n=1 Tax=Streptosporangium brasiliense TaxID=47480 RepID=A0ABT9RA28_9ACTN|nr:D-isomer specific 2-hydroxyacid dehydrogenase family protein [Streptosporangium brasiliense]MDP9865701.1 phosphoglycerate dehydrogenase-like enzyme [Streptosporangium brasiliense]
MEARIAIAPSAEMGAAYGRANSPDLDLLRSNIEKAVSAGGGVNVPPAEAEGLVWLVPGEPEELRAALDGHPGIRWVQFPWAGVEKFAVSGIFDRPVVFTCAKGSFAGQVSEHALMLTLACLRSVVRQARTPHWSAVDPRSLHGRRVTILGGGGIATELVRLLQPFDCRIRVLRRRPEKVEGAGETLPPTALHAVLPGTDVLVLALALTPETRHVIGAAELALLPADAVVVNVARGAHIDTDALAGALRDGTISAAGLDVTDPEPLPEGHPLWSDPRALITSHCADSAEYVMRMLCERVERNVRRLREGLPLEGVIDPATGY